MNSDPPTNSADLVANGTVDVDGRQSRRNQPSTPLESHIQDVTPFGRKLTVRRVMSMWGGDDVYAEEEDLPAKKVHDSTQYAFTIVRPNSNQGYNRDVAERSIHVRSVYFMKVAKVVMQAQKNVAWDANPVKFKDWQLLAFMPEFKKYSSSLRASPASDPERAEIILHLEFFIDFMELEYNDQLRELYSLQKQNRVSFRLLWGIFVPGILLISQCGQTEEPIAVRLVHVERNKPERFNTGKGPRLCLLCESTDFNAGVPTVVEKEWEIARFDGEMLLTDLPIWPMHAEANCGELRKILIERGHRYRELSKVWCHKQYSGVASWRQSESGERKIAERRIAVNSRIVIDKAMYMTYSSPRVESSSRRMKSRSPKTSRGPQESTTDAEIDMMLAPALLHGFSLADRAWLELNVNHVEDITWNPESFDYLEVEQGKKELVRALIQSHIQRSVIFDDIIAGKGIGLILNFHGPPGVGKTLTAEAMCEVVQKPLYMVGAGDLGGTARELDKALNVIFALATEWQAIVLIDEADVFLEKRAMDDLTRNAMVAVFLRQLEYFPGILILTTNRLVSFDDAIKSRIHVSLTFANLTAKTRERLWRAFLRKAGLSENQLNAINMDLLLRLPFNGREIKNIVKTASTFASHCGRALSIEDILRVAETNIEPNVGHYSLNVSSLMRYKPVWGVHVLLAAGVLLVAIVWTFR